MNEPTTTHDWQPIETAPENTVMLAYHPLTGRFFASLSKVDRTEEATWWAHDDPEDLDEGTTHPGPTHWIPLPAPPEAR